MTAAPPAFDRPQRLHPLSLVYRLLTSLPYFVVLLVPLFRNPEAQQWIGAGFALFLGALTVPWIFASYFRFRYHITPREVIIEQGVFTRQTRNIPLDRIQNVEIQQSMLQRALGLARVRLETAGSAGSEGVLQFVDPDTARAVRRVIRSYQQEADPEAPADADAPPEPDVTESDTHLIHAMPASEVVRAGAFRFSLVYIALFFTGLQYLNIQPERVVEWVIEQQVGRLVQDIEAPGWALVLAGVLTAALLSWITSIVVTVNRYHRFRLWMHEGKLHKKHGLFTVSEGTIPLRRMQLLRFRAHFPMRRFDRIELATQTMGLDPRQQGRQTVVPLAPSAEIFAVAGRLMPIEPPESYQRVSPLTIRRACVRYTLATLVVVGALTRLSGAFWWGLLALPALYGLAVLQYRMHGYALTPQHVWVRRGFWQHYVWIVPYDRLQVFSTSSTLFQRRLKLKTLHLDTAGGHAFTYPRLVDLPADTADALLKEVYQRFQDAAASSPQRSRHPERGR